MDRFSEHAEGQKESPAHGKKRRMLRHIVSIGVGAGLGFLLGMGLAAADVALPPIGDSLGDLLFFFAEIFVLFWLACFAQIVLHEAGHLIFGLATGYRFCSFTVGGIMLVRADGRLRLRALSIAGMGGQCLMAPPRGVEPERMPFVWYNLGGVLMNLLSAALFGALVPAVRGVPMLPLFFLLLALIGLLFAALNGVPMRTEMIDNDGKNIVSLSKSPTARRALWLQLYIGEQQARGARLRDMPEEWFALPDESEWGNCLLVTLAVFRANRLLDAHDIDGAAALIDRLFAAETGMAGIHRILLTCDRMFCALLRDDTETVERLYTKAQRRLMKQMRLNPSVLRTEYALDLLHGGSSEQAEKCLALFEAHASKHPYPCEIESERELIALAAEKYAGRKSEAPAE